MKMAQQSLEARLRWIVERDMPQIVRIEEASFHNPWRVEDFVEVLCDRDVIGLTLAHESVVLGYMIYEYHPRYYTILSMAVRPDLRRCGLGRQMVERMQHKLQRSERRAVWADVCEENLAGQVFFRQCGFAATGIARGCYEVHGEEIDAYRFIYTLEPR